MLPTDIARAAPEAPPLAATDDLRGEGRPRGAQGASAAPVAPGGNGARVEGMDGATPLGLDAAPTEGDPMAETELPSHATMYVAHAVANDALIRLALSLGATLAVTHPDEREAQGTALLDQVLSRFPLFMDCKPARIADTLAGLGPYDADEAESLAEEIVGDGIKLIRDRLL